MDEFLHRWLLVYLYHLATWLRHEAYRLQVTIRRALLFYASRSYNTQKPLTKTVIPWQKRLAEAEKAGKPISPIRHRREMHHKLHCPNCAEASLRSASLLRASRKMRFYGTRNS